MLFAHATSAAVWADIQRLFEPTMQYIAGEVGKVMRLDLAVLDVSSLSAMLVCLLLRMCGLLGDASSVLTFDAVGAARTMLANVPYADAAAAAAARIPGLSVVAAGAQASLALVGLGAVTEAGSAMGSVLPDGVALGTALGAYTRRGADGGRSWCELWAAKVGTYIDQAAIYVMVFQICLDIGAAGYIHAADGQAAASDAADIVPPLHAQPRQCGREPQPTGAARCGRGGGNRPRCHRGRHQCALCLLWCRRRPAAGRRRTQEAALASQEGGRRRHRRGRVLSLATRSQH